MLTKLTEGAAPASLFVMQPAAIHGDQFAVASSLAIYVYSAEDFVLRKVLVQHDKQLTALCWSPVDALLLACATKDQASMEVHVVLQLQTV